MPNMMKSIFKFSTAGADYLLTQADDIAEESVGEVLDNIEADIKDNWSSSSPSDPYNPPAVVTGYLDQSIKTERRDERGRFASFGNAKRWELRVEADYGLALEFGVPERMLIERPFFLPAIYRAEDKLGMTITANFQVAAVRANALTKTQFLARSVL